MTKKAKSKLEVYEDVLKILSNNPSSLDAIAFEGNMDCMLLRQKMDFLVENELVKEATSQKKTVYSLTYRGEAIFKTLTLAKRLEKLQAAIVGADREVQAVQPLQGEAWKAKRKR